MKCLILLKWKPGPPPDPQIVIRMNEGVKAWIQGNVAGGFLDCAYNVIPSAPGYYGMGIANGSSLEEMFAKLTTYPGFVATDFEVYPLSEVMSAIDNVSATFRQLAGG